MSERELFELWLADRSNFKVNVRSFSTFMRDDILSLRVENYDSGSIVKNEHGKPYIPGSPFSFSLSNCGNDYAFLLCSCDRCGVDIQKPESPAKYGDAFRSVFTDGELDSLGRIGLDGEYTRLWSLKEAFIKAMGGSIWYGRDYELYDEKQGSEGKWYERYGVYLHSSILPSGTYLAMALSVLPGRMEMVEFS